MERGQQCTAMAARFWLQNKFARTRLSALLWLRFLMHRILSRFAASPRDGLQTQNFSRLALGGDFNRAAANLAIGRETLGGRAGVNHQFKALTAERTLDGRRDFHGSGQIRP